MKKGTLSTAERLVGAISEMIVNNQKLINIQIDQSIGLKEGPCALTELWSWGRNGQNQLGTGRGLYSIPITFKRSRFLIEHIE